MRERHIEHDMSCMSVRVVVMQGSTNIKPCVHLHKAVVDVRHPIADSILRVDISFCMKLGGSRFAGAILIMEVRSCSHCTQQVVYPRAICYSFLITLFLHQG